MGAEQRKRKTFSHHQQSIVFRKETPLMSITTPWGKSRESACLCPGVTHYNSTEGGGVRVSPMFRSRIPKSVRKEWYDEKDEINIPLFYFADEIMKSNSWVSNCYESPEEIRRFAASAVGDKLPKESLEEFGLSDMPDQEEVFNLTPLTIGEAVFMEDEAAAI